MSANLRSALGPCRQRLTELLGTQPEIQFEFETPRLRDAHLRALKTYRQKLIAKKETFSKWYEQLISRDYEDANEQRIVQQIAQTDAELLTQYDDTHSALTAAIEEIEAHQAQQAQQAQLAQLNLVQNDHAQNGGNIAGAARTSARLPKIELPKFSGEIMHWQEFWDTFEASVHNNTLLSAVEKLHYLKGQLTGEAKCPIMGLASTNENYDVAVSTLKERFGKTQTVIDAHYVALTNLVQSSNSSTKLRLTVDTIEQHLNSLSTLREDVNHRHFVSLIRSKLPPEVILRLEELQGGQDWTVKLLRERLHAYLSARELADSQGGNLNSVKMKSDTVSNGGYMPQRTTTGSMFSNSKTKGHKRDVKCIFCGETHFSDECRKFPTVELRKQKILGNCFGCLKPGHGIRTCEIVKPCFHCKKEKNHHRSLCPQKFGRVPESTNLATDRESSQESTPTTASVTETSCLASGQTVLLQTAQAEVHTHTKSISTRARLLLDTGSHRSYISEKLANSLKLKGIRMEKLSVNTFGTTTSKEVKTSLVRFQLKLRDGSFLEIEANVVPVITGNLCRALISFDKFRLYKNLPLADPIPDQPEIFTADILIGTDNYFQIVTSERIDVSEGLHLIGSKLGWILTGVYDTKIDTKIPTATMFVSTVGTKVPDLSHVSFDSQIERKLDVSKLWDLETIGITEKANDMGDEDALKRFEDTVEHRNGRYFVSWPWKSDVADLPENFQLALGRLNSTIKRLSKEPQLMIEYDSIIQKQLESGIIERVNIHSPTMAKCHYIPHHAVVTPHKSTKKVRIVFDGSAKTKNSNLSINDCLYRGPILLDDLSAVLMRFRLNKVALLADIEKAFLQIGLHNEERDVIPFIWLRDPSLLKTDGNIEVYRFTRVPFGIVSSPFLLGATIDHHIRKNGTVTSQQVLRDLYVDNLVTGVKSKEEAVDFYYKTKELFSAASMNIREWLSNSSEFLQMIPKSDRASSQCDVLGIAWSPNEDKLAMGLPSHFDTSQSLTKRLVLKYIASFFDPLGLASPVLLRMKVFLQSLWEQKLDWDDELPVSLHQEWQRTLTENSTCLSIQVPRYVGGDTGASFDLHCFCDASQKAYGACVYLLSVSPTETTSHLVFAKSRLAPVRSAISIPRLELLAVCIGTRCLSFVKRSLPIIIRQTFLWSDSQCVLAWIESDKTLTPFVCNRIQEIRKLSDIWYHYIPTSENPADVESRGCSSCDLKENVTWWHGPPWLADKTLWPKQSSQVTADCSIIPEIQSEETFPLGVFPVSEGAKAEMELVIDSTRVSSLMKLLRVTARCLRWVPHDRQKVPVSQSHIEAHEIERAKLVWLKLIQETYYSEVIISLKQKGKHPLIKELDLWVDKDGLLHCGGRLTNADLSEMAMHPILLPKNDHFTDLIIRHFHEKLRHVGVSHTLAQIRNEFWVPSGRARVLTNIKACLRCKRFDGGPYQPPQVPPLPSSRVTECAPFTYTGLDYLGPLFMKANGKSEKIWVCIFTCMVTRAVHLDMVHNLTAFTSRQGIPHFMLSDNACQFKLAKTAIARLWRTIEPNPAVQSYLSEHGITWSFIIERAPWMGGFYERLIRHVKQALRKSIQHVLLTCSQLQTVITEIEAILNSRPLVYVGADVRDGDILTPAHFLSLNRKTGHPSVSKEAITDNAQVSKICSAKALLQNWSRGQRHLQTFWKVWKDQYLLSLRERKTMAKHVRGALLETPRVGDLVHIRQDSPRGSWPLGRVQEILFSKDGAVRAARVILPSGRVLNRAILHLYPLECQEEPPINERDDLIPMDDDDACSIQY